MMINDPYHSNQNPPLLHPASSASREGSQSRQIHPKKTSSDLLSGPLSKRRLNMVMVCNDDDQHNHSLCTDHQRSNHLQTTQHHHRAMPSTGDDFISIFSSFKLYLCWHTVWICNTSPSRELPPRPRDRESMKRQQSVEVTLTSKFFSLLNDTCFFIRHLYSPCAGGAFKRKVWRAANSYQPSLFPFFHFFYKIEKIIFWTTTVIESGTRGTTLANSHQGKKDLAR